MAERNRIERSPHDGATAFETVWGANPSTLLLAGSRRCRSPCPCGHHSGSSRGREPSRLTAHENGGRLWSCSTSPDGLQSASNRCRRACPVNRPYPCSDSNREPPRSKRGTSTVIGLQGPKPVRAKRFERSLDRLSTCCLCRVGLRALVRAEGFQPSLVPGLSRPPLAVGLCSRRPEGC